MSAKEMIGLKFGKLFVLSRSFGFVGTSRAARYLCKCDCGNEKVITGIALRIGTVVSCGCFMRENNGNKKRTHGKSYTKVYKCWINMKARCYRKTHHKYYMYGARGIKVCDGWLESFENFYADMGDPPDGRSIDRINNNGNYEPGNCRWATIKQQQNNTRRNISNKQSNKNDYSSPEKN